MAPAGTITDNCVTLEEITVALTAPKRTILFAGTGSKLLPLIVIVVPIFPLVGVNPVIDGACEMPRKGRKEQTNKRRLK